MKIAFCRCVALLALTFSWPLHAGEPAEAIRECHRNADDDARRACYDRVTGYAPERRADAPAADAASPQKSAAAPAPAPLADRSLRTSWLLGRAEAQNVGDIEPHRQSYIIYRWSSRPNRMPSSPAPGHTTLQPLDIDSGEAKFQLSFKSELVSPTWLRALGGQSKLADELGRMRLWLAYTQQSNWQALNSRNSSPFRENNYEPEAILTYDNSDRSEVFKLVNFGVAHHSNGRSGAESRSWNKGYVQAGLQFGGEDATRSRVSMLVRRVWRFDEDARDDDNPNIQDYWGRAELVTDWHLPPHDTTISIVSRHNLRSNGRGYTQLAVSSGFRSLGRTRWYAQIGRGYGESLIDYNHRQSYVGFGLSFGQ